ncbi:hypothetical protein [Bradyrhizobium sp. 930_D9_N1_4]|uniref:hypothetical protein n=1 Tax=Bradyrhizobium sp. 930_D9_N1_4 TaxID=3240374 RepID=UPI003F8BA8C3
MFQGMPLAAAEDGASRRDFEDLPVLPLHVRGNAIAVLAGHSRLISFIFCVERKMRTQSTTVIIGATENCIRVLARFCSTSRQACTAGSDLVWIVTNLQQALFVGCNSSGAWGRQLEAVSC